MNGRIVVAAVSLLISGCGSEERVTILKAALSQNPSEPPVRAVELFADLVFEGTEGRIRVQVYPNNQLGNQRDVVEGLQMGSVELANIASVMASFVPETNLFELPFLFDGPEHFDAVLDSSTGQTTDPIVQQLPDGQSWRVSFVLSPAGDQPADMRLYLTEADRRVSETWNYVWYPDHIIS